MTLKQHADTLIRTYRPIPPLRVWHGLICLPGVMRWLWYCRLCERGHLQPTWGEAMLDSLGHLYRFHTCPSLRASGEPCTDYCTDCGGKGWIK